MAVLAWRSGDGDFYGILFHVIKVHSYFETYKRIWFETKLITEAFHKITKSDNMRNCKSELRLHFDFYFHVPRKEKEIKCSFRKDL